MQRYACGRSWATWRSESLVTSTVAAGSVLLLSCMVRLIGLNHNYENRSISAIASNRLDLKACSKNACSPSKNNPSNIVLLKPLSYSPTPLRSCLWCGVLVGWRSSANDLILMHLGLSFFQAAQLGQVRFKKGGGIEYGVHEPKSCSQV